MSPTARAVSKVEPTRGVWGNAGSDEQFRDGESWRDADKSTD